MNNTYVANNVAEFQKQYENPILDKPTIPSDRKDLRVDLIKEEYKELRDAVRDNDLVETADALGDIMYVLYGAILEFGFSDSFEEIFNEIHRSNMSKACESIKVAEKTINHYYEKDGTESYYKKVGEKYVVYRSNDNKVLKSVNYSPANLSDILSKY